jgi:hypothetical protein
MSSVSIKPVRQKARACSGILRQLPLNVAEASMSLIVVEAGLASKKILLANSSCWGGSHHEPGKGGLPGSCERRASEPSP